MKKVYVLYADGTNHSRAENFLIDTGNGWNLGVFSTPEKARKALHEGNMGYLRYDEKKNVECFFHGKIDESGEVSIQNMPCIKIIEYTVDEVQEN